MQKKKEKEKEMFSSVAMLVALHVGGFFKIYMRDMSIWAQMLFVSRIFSVDISQLSTSMWLLLPSMLLSLWPHPRGSVGREPRIESRTVESECFCEIRHEFATTIQIRKAKFELKWIGIDLESKMSELWLCFPCCVTEQPQPVRSNEWQILSISCLDQGILRYCVPVINVFSLYFVEETQNRSEYDWRTYEF